MYPSHGLGSGSSRNTSNHPSNNDQLDLGSGAGERGRSGYNMYSHIVPVRPAPPPPTSARSGLGRHPSTTTTNGGTRSSGSGRDPLARRSSLGVPQPLGYSGLSATRPQDRPADLGLPSLLPPLTSGRRSGSGNTGGRPVGLSSPRLGSGELGSGLGTGGSGRLRDEPNASMYSRSQPIDIAPTHLGQGDWRNRLSPGPELENPTNRETRREARRRTRQDWEEDGELHPNVSLESDLEDSTDGETDSPVGSMPRRRTRSLRRTPEMENLRNGDDSGIGLGNPTGRSLSRSSRASDDFGLGGLSLSGSGGFNAGGGATYLPPTINGQRERRGGFSSTGATAMERLPELDLGSLAPMRRSRYPPPGPAPSFPLPPLPTSRQPSGGLDSLGGFGGLPPLGGRRPSLPDTTTPLGMYTDPFAAPPRVPGQHRIREHMLEFTDGDYTVRIRHNQRARQQQQQEQRGRSSNSSGSGGGLAEARRLGF